MGSQRVGNDWSNSTAHHSIYQFSSVQFSRSVVSDSLPPHELQHARPPCPSPTPWVHSNPCPSSRWCHPAISSSVIPFSCPQSLPASGSFSMSQLFTSGGQRIGVSASTSVLSMNTQDWSPLGWTDLLAVQGTLKSLLQHHSSKPSILGCSAFFTVAAARRSYPTPEVRASGREELPHVQGAAAARAQEGREELVRVQGQEGRPGRYPSSEVRSGGCALLEQPWRDTPRPRSEKPKEDGRCCERASEGRHTKTILSIIFVKYLLSPFILFIFIILTFYAPYCIFNYLFFTRFKFYFYFFYSHHLFPGRLYFCLVLFIS